MYRKSGAKNTSFCKLYLGDEGLHAGHVVNVPLHNYRLKTLKIIFIKLNREHLK